jgi:starvation-inducible DNA-binding protein
MRWDVYDLLKGGEQRGEDLLAGGEQKGPELSSSAPRTFRIWSAKPDPNSGTTSNRSEGDAMVSPATSTYLPTLEIPHEREGVGHELQATLHELIDLSLIGKQLHWAVVGPLFRPLHLQLDELVESWHEQSDTVAERADALGVIPDGQARAVVAGSQLAPVARESLEDHVVVRELTHRVAEVSERVRDRMNLLGNVDLASQDVLIEVVRELEKQQWMLRAQLGERA